MRREEEIVARRERAFAFAVDLDPRRSGGEEHPFVMPLVVPEAGRRGLSGRDDPFDADARPAQQLCRCLLAGRNI